MTISISEDDITIKVDTSVPIGVLDESLLDPSNMDSGTADAGQVATANGSGGIAWLDQAGGATAATQSDISTAVDYSDVTAVDPASGQVFTTQTEVDDYLAANGATAFKHLSRLFDALPPVIAHAIELAIAAGVHRPDPTDSARLAAYQMTGKVFAGNGLITLTGAAAGWATVSGPLTVTSHVTESNNPSITFAGTPFVAGALRGRYAVIDTGQVAVINANTADTLFVSNGISPGLVNGSTTVEVAKPAAVLRNSLTDAAASAQNDQCVRFENNVLLKNLTIEGWAPGSVAGATFGTDLYYQGRYSDPNLANEYILVDSGAYYDNTASHTNQQNSCYFDIDARKSIVMRNFIIRNADKPNDRTNFAAQILNGTLFGFGGAIYVKGSKRGIIASRANLSLRNTIFDELGDVALGNATDGGLIRMINGSSMTSIHFGSGVLPEVRNCLIRPTNTTQACIFLDNDPANVVGGEFNQMAFANNEAHCIRVDRGTIKPGVFTDGGGNLRTGILVNGPGAIVLLATTDTVSGALGDLEIDGVVGPYGDIPASATPLVTGRLNLVGRD